MRKSDNNVERIATIEFKEGKIFLDKNPFSIGDNIDNLLQRFPYLKYSEDVTKYFDVYKFINVNGLSFNVKKKLISEMIISFFPNPNPFAGEVYVNDKLIPVPFLAKDVDIIFPGLVLKKLPSIYDDVYDTNAFNFYSFFGPIKYDIKINRDSKHVGLISLRSTDGLLVN